MLLRRRPPQTSLSAQAGTRALATRCVEAHARGPNAEPLAERPGASEHRRPRRTGTRGGAVGDALDGGLRPRQPADHRGSARAPRYRRRAVRSRSGLIRANGQRIWVRAVGQAVIEGGPVVRVLGIIADVIDRRLVEKEIRKLNAELEQSIAARTGDLERANRELETFAYSLSHDPRAPLRAVDGFSKVLLDDYAHKLDEDGCHYLERARAGAVRMGNLIDKILQLSRLSRRGFERVPADISALTREIAVELNDAEPDRPVEVEIEDGLLAQADLALIHSVLQNLSRRGGCAHEPGG